MQMSAVRFGNVKPNTELHPTQKPLCGFRRVSFNVGQVG